MESKIEYRLSFDCPHCLTQWAITATVRRADACPRCGTVSRYTRVRALEPIKASAITAGRGELPDGSQYRFGAL